MLIKKKLKRKLRMYVHLKFKTNLKAPIIITNTNFVITLEFFSGTYI